MERIRFFDSGVDAVEILTIIFIGLIATTFMFGFRWACLRFGILRKSRARGIGTFLIPEPVNEPLLEWMVHSFGGIFFTIIYGFIFDFVSPQSIARFLSIGAVLGLVHGYFISFFVLLGFSGLRAENIAGRFSFLAPLVNVTAHVVFGSLVGLGFAYAELTSLFWQYAFFMCAIEFALGLALLNIPSREREENGTLAHPRTQ